MRSKLISFGFVASLFFGVYLLYFTLIDLDSFPSGYSLDLLAGLFFAIDLSALLVLLPSTRRRGRLPALTKASGKVFWILLAATLIFVPMVPSSSSFRVTCNANWTPQITVDYLSSPTYTMLGFGVIYGAYFTAYSIVNAWPIDGFRLAAWNNTLAGTYVPPADYCPPS